jgi:LDH2 family malate/lactate/ureidoglycolate dehydrogenase
VLVLAFDPKLFGGADDFVRETGWLAQACRAARPAQEGTPVRLPGEAGLARKRRAEAEGVRLAPTILPELEGLAEKFAIAVPAPLPVSQDDLALEGTRP